MSICPKCRKEISDAAKICPHCNTDIDEFRRKRKEELDRLEKEVAEKQSVFRKKHVTRQKFREFLCKQQRKTENVPLDFGSGNFLGGDYICSIFLSLKTTAM